MKLYAYKPGSQSASDLARAIGIVRINHEGGVLRVPDAVINWGSSNMARPIVTPRILNNPNNVAIAADKLRTFQVLLGGVDIPEYTTNKGAADVWLAGGQSVMERHKLRGHSGAGIVHVPSTGTLSEGNAPLYVKYIPKTEEYRLHVFHRTVFFTQQKMRKRDTQDWNVNWKVRNLTNGFVYAHHDLAPLPERVRQMAVKAVDLLGLDFGAVDIIYNRRQDKYFVLEVNTACGLAGATLEAYANQFREFADTLPRPAR